MDQRLPVEGNLTATVYSVEHLGDNSSVIVITVATNSSEPPASLTRQLIHPLEQTLEEVADINEQISFVIVTNERYGTYIRYSIYSTVNLRVTHVHIKCSNVCCELRNHVINLSITLLYYPKMVVQNCQTLLVGMLPL